MFILYWSVAEGVGRTPHHDMCTDSHYICADSSWGHILQKSACTKIGNETTIQLTSENLLSTSICPRMYWSASKSTQMRRFILMTHFATATLLLNLLYKMTIGLTCENSHPMLIRRRMRRSALISAYRCADPSSQKSASQKSDSQKSACYSFCRERIKSKISSIPSA